MANQEAAGLRRLHLGCGKTILPGWINLDVTPGDNVDIVADLEECATKPLPLPADSIDEFLGSHVLEHIRNSLPLMQELHRVAKPNAKAVFHLPFGSSDDAHEDPTHVRQYYLNSFSYFSQPTYWRADYGYRGDWQPDLITLKVNQSQYPYQDAGLIFQDIMRYRNVVVEMTAELTAIKPIRQPLRELHVAPKINITLI